MLLQKFPHFWTHLKVQFATYFFAIHEEISGPWNKDKIKANKEHLVVLVLVLQQPLKTHFQKSQVKEPQALKSHLQKSPVKKPQALKTHLQKTHVKKPPLQNFPLHKFQHDLLKPCLLLNHHNQCEKFAPSFYWVVDAIKIKLDFIKS